MTMALSLPQLNAAPLADASQWLDGLYEHSPWIAQAALAHRPFKSLGVVYNPKEANTRFMLEDLTDEARRNGIELLDLPKSVLHLLTPPQGVFKDVTVTHGNSFQFLSLQLLD